MTSARKMRIACPVILTSGRGIVVQCRSSKGNPIQIRIEDLDNYEIHCAIHKLSAILADRIKADRMRHGHTLEVVRRAWSTVKDSMECETP